MVAALLAGRIQARRSLLHLAACCLLGGLASFAGPANADQESPETTIGRLEFRIVDAKPEAGPVRAFRYTYEILQAGQKEPLCQRNIAYRSEDGILRIPPPFPPFGRVGIWIGADDGQSAYRHGYASFSYRIDAGKSLPMSTIALREGVVLTGKVLDAETGKPIAAAQVAPVKHGHHFNWADWKEAAKTDAEGKYRITTTGAEGIAVRHPKYREQKLDDRHWSLYPGHNVRKSTSWSAGGQQQQDKVGPEGFVFRLHPLIAVRGRLVTPDGKPIADAEISELGGSRSDRDGRFVLNVTREEWNQRENHQIKIYASDFRTQERRLRDFSLDGELAITLQPETRIEGQVLDERGRPLKDCKIELRCEAEFFRSDFYEVPGPYKQGRWQRSISEHETVFTLRVSVGGMIRIVKRYTRQEVTKGPIVTRLAEGRQVTGRLVARVPLDEKNMPLVVLASAVGRADDGLIQQAQVQSDGRFTFSGLTDGKYTLRLLPALSKSDCARAIDAGARAFTIFGFDSPNKLWERAVTIQGRDVKLDPIDLHQAGLLPGCLTGVAYQPGDGRLPLANAFGYLCAGKNTFDSIGNLHYLLQFMMDAEGRFRVENCPPGKYLLRLSEHQRPGPRGPGTVWIRVTPEKTLDLRLFSAESDRLLAIRFVVGDGSLHDAYAGAGLDEELIGRYRDKKTGELPYIKDATQRFRARTPEISCRLEPLDETIDCWPLFMDQFQFRPENLLKRDRPHVVIPNVTPGRWRLTLEGHYGLVFSCDETLMTRDLVLGKGPGPLVIPMPAAALVGAFENPVDGGREQVAVQAIPLQPGEPTRTCHGQGNFRFMGLPPGEYTLRIRAAGCEEKQLAGVRVVDGKTTWLEKIVLERSTSKTKGPRNQPLRQGNAP